MTEFKDLYQTVHDTADTLRKGNFNESDIKIAIDILDYVTENNIEYVRKLIDLAVSTIRISGNSDRIFGRDMLQKAVKESAYLDDYAKQYIASKYSLTFEEIVYGEGEKHAD